MTMPQKTPVALKRKRTNQLNRTVPKRTKQSRRQAEYHSSSEDDEQLRNAVDTYGPTSSRNNGTRNTPAEPSDDTSPSDVNLENSEEDAYLEKDDSEDSDAASSTSPGGEQRTKPKKRNDPDAFATSLQKILGSRLSTAKRADPILSRSKVARDAGKELAESKLESKARHKLRDERHALLEKGHVADIMGFNTTDISTQQIQEEERRLQKTAQRGVIKLFNAVRAAQVKGEQAAREAKAKGVVGLDKREEKVAEMSKKGFLDLIAGGGKKTTPV